jgi:Ser/Thr protein kinase RdoA (MazF antagonist)
MTFSFTWTVSDGAPRFLGVDDQGREILSFLPGEVPRDVGHYSDVQLAAAAVLLRRFHDATARFGPVTEKRAEVICHNDWGPPNAVFCDGLPYGIIDFDTIAPGLRLWDLGHSAWLWLNIGHSRYTADEQLRRLDLFTVAYDLPTCSVPQIAAFAVARQTALATWASARGDKLVADWASATADWTVRNITERLLPTRPK